MSLKIAEKLCVMKMTNDEKFEEELTCQFKIDMKNFTNFDLEHSKISKICSLMGFFLTKYKMFELRKA